MGVIVEEGQGRKLTLLREEGLATGGGVSSMGTLSGRVSDLGGRPV